MHEYSAVVIGGSMQVSNSFPAKVSFMIFLIIEPSQETWDQGCVANKSWLRLKEEIIVQPEKTSGTLFVPISTNNTTVTKEEILTQGH